MVAIGPSGRLTTAAQPRPFDVHREDNADAAGFSRLLGTNPNELTGSDSAERIEDLREHWPKFNDPVRPARDQNHSDLARLEVLLKRDALIDSQERIETFRQHQLEEFAVPLRRPTAINHVVGLELGQVAQERPGNALIEQ